MGILRKRCAHLRGNLPFPNREGLPLRSQQFDDLSDEGALQSKPEAHQVGVDISMEVLRNPDAPPPNFPYAAMLHE